MQTTDNDNSDPVHLDSLLTKGVIGRIVSKVNLLKQLNSTLATCFTEAGAPPCQITRLEFNTVTITCTNQATAHRLYYQQNQLLSALTQAHPNLPLTNIQIKVSKQ